LTVEISCPACRKLNLVSNDRADTACVRCGCELDQLVGITRAARAELQDARDTLQAGDLRAALDHATRSWSLHRSRHAIAVAALAAACSGDAATLNRWRDRWTEAQT
jgi:hypothetical protein